MLKRQPRQRSKCGIALTHNKLLAPVQRTIRILRVALPLVFIARSGHRAYWRRATAQDKSGAAPVTIDDPSQRQAGILFDDLRGHGRPSTGVWLSHPGPARGRLPVGMETRFENVQMTIYRPTGLTYDLVCPQAQFKGNTKRSRRQGRRSRDLE